MIRLLSSALHIIWYMCRQVYGVSRRRLSQPLGTPSHRDLSLQVPRGAWCGRAAERYAGRCTRSGPGMRGGDSSFACRGWTTSYRRRFSSLFFLGDHFCSGNKPAQKIYVRVMGKVWRRTIRKESTMAHGKIYTHMSCTHVPPRGVKGTPIDHYCRGCWPRLVVFHIIRTYALHVIDRFREPCFEV